MSEHCAQGLSVTDGSSVSHTVLCWFPSLSVFSLGGKRREQDVHLTVSVSGPGSLAGV